MLAKSINDAAVWWMYRCVCGENTVCRTVTVQNTVCRTVAVQNTVCTTVAVQNTVCTTVAVQNTVCRTVAVQNTVCRTVAVQNTVCRTVAVQNTVCRTVAVQNTVCRTVAVQNPDSLKLTSILTYLLTAVGLTPGGSSTVHIYTQTIHRTTLQLWLEGFLGFEHRVVKLKLTNLGLKRVKNIKYKTFKLNVPNTQNTTLFWNIPTYAKGNVPMKCVKIKRSINEELLTRKKYAINLWVHAVETLFQLLLLQPATTKLARYENEIILYLTNEKMWQDMSNEKWWDASISLQMDWYKWTVIW